MKKYIFYSDKFLKRAGGPSTYLYNLKNGLKEYDSKSKIIFLHDETEKISESNVSKFKEKLKNIIIKFPRIYERIYIIRKSKRNDVYKKLSSIKKDDIIMFHSSEDFSKAYDLIPSSCTKILMSHSPEVLSLEITNFLKSKNEKYDFKRALEYFYNKFDLFAFNNADIIVFPSKESMEPYYQTCDQFSEIIKKKNVYFLETGTEELKYNYSKDEYRKKIGIPKDAFVLCFVGRHNSVKGYDNFIEIAKEMLARYDNVYVTTAGVGNIETPKIERWIDMGWTDDPGSIINASDIFVLSNKRTYFDLILLEIISLGKPCIASNTGGNITVSKYTDGIVLYDTISEAIEKIDYLYNNTEILKDYGNKNKKLYEQRYTVEKFIIRYIDFFDKIVDKKKSNKIKNNIK